MPTPPHPEEDAPADPFLNPIYNILGGRPRKTLTQAVEERQAELGISGRHLSQILGMSRPSLDRILSGEAKKLDAMTVLKLSHFLGKTAEETLEVFAASMSPAEVREVERVRATEFLVRNFDIERLKQIGVVDSVSDINAVLNRVVTFLGLETIFDYSSQLGYSLFSTVRRPFEDRMLEFWVKSAYKQFERIANPNEFDPATLRQLAPQIRQYTRHEQRGLLTVVRALYRAGVTVIVQSYLPRTSVRGGTFIVNKKPCIVLTNRGNMYPTLWFTLMHELGHVLFHWDKLQTVKYHVSGAADMFLVEDEANYFARELLFPEDKLKYVAAYIDAPGVVHKYAADNNVHPSLIYALHAHRQMEAGDADAWKRYRSNIPSADLAVRELRSHPWDKESIQHEADRVRALLTQHQES